MKRSTQRPSSSSRISAEYDDNRRPTDAFCFGATSRPACLVREVQQMPTHQREDVMRDLLGIQHLDELPQERVADLFGHLENLEEKSAWELALEMDQTYATSPRLAMAFLRSVGGKPKQAAKRFARHFQVKLDLFGAEKLVKDIELSDLDEDDMEALCSGGFQVLPSKDAAGRPILFGRYTLMKYREPKNIVKSLFYIWSSMVEDEEHQKSGVVAIGFENGKLPLERFDNDVDSSFDLSVNDVGFDRDLAREILKIPLSVPIRPMGYHICADSTQWQSIFDMVLSTICKFVRVRIRFHYGTTQETKYALMTHGIPVDSFPITETGDVDLSSHHAWIDSRRQLEEARRLEKSSS